LTPPPPPSYTYFKIYEPQFLNYLMIGPFNLSRYSVVKGNQEKSFKVADRKRIAYTNLKVGHWGDLGVNGWITL